MTVREHTQPRYTAIFRPKHIACRNEIFTTSPQRKHNLRPSQSAGRYPTRYAVAIVPAGRARIGLGKPAARPGKLFLIFAKADVMKVSRASRQDLARYEATPSTHLVEVGSCAATAPSYSWPLGAALLLR